MLNVLQDIDQAQSMLSSGGTTASGKGKKGGQAKAGTVKTVPHPVDVNYGLLNAKLNLIPTDSQEYKIIK